MLPHWSALRYEHKWIGKAARECAEIATASANILICSAAALEYVGLPRALEFAHLDIHVLRRPMQNGILTGILPQIWGIEPMSNSTRAWIRPQRSRQRLGA